MNLLECINTRFFKLRRNARLYCERQTHQGHWCHIAMTDEGSYVVNVFREVL